jgi:hypothetical protein
VAATDALDKPYLLRVPITSVVRDKVLRTGLRDFVATLKTRGVEYNEVVVQIGFDYSAPGIKLTFTPVGILDQASYEQVCALYEDQTVRDIVGKSRNEVPADGAAVAEVLNDAKAAQASAIASVLDEDVRYETPAKPKAAPESAPKPRGRGRRSAQEAETVLSGIDTLLDDYDD